MDVRLYLDFGISLSRDTREVYIHAQFRTLPAIYNAKDLGIPFPPSLSYNHPL